MKIGCCLPLFDDRILLLRELGADYAEIGLSQIAERPIGEIRERAEALREAGVACLSANLLFPGSLRLTGENADHEAAAAYLETALPKAALLGVRTVVFGSGGTRAVPEGFSREKAWKQLRALCANVIAPAAAKNGMICCIEPLGLRECNILNTCAETAKLVREVDAPEIRLLVDLYHFDQVGEDRRSLSGYRGLLRHAHIASAKNGRDLPKPGDGEDYTEFFDALRGAGYEGNVSLEGNMEGRFEETVRRSVAYLKTFA